MVASKDLESLIGKAPAPKADEVSTEMVRKLLALNPALRNQGMTTEGTVSMVQKARSGVAPTTPTASAASPAADPSADVVATVRALQTGLHTQRADVDKQIAELQKRRQKIAADTLAQFTAWLEKHDADVRSPVTQKIIEREKNFFTDIGFSMDAYVDHRMNKKP